MKHKRGLLTDNSAFCPGPLRWLRVFIFFLLLLPMFSNGQDIPRTFNEMMNWTRRWHPTQHGGPDSLFYVKYGTYNNLVSKWVFRKNTLYIDTSSTITAQVPASLYFKFTCFPGVSGWYYTADTVNIDTCYSTGGSQLWDLVAGHLAPSGGVDSVKVKIIQTDTIFGFYDTVFTNHFDTTYTLDLVSHCYDTLNGFISLTDTIGRFRTNINNNYFTDFRICDVIVIDLCCVIEPDTICTYQMGFAIDSISVKGGYTEFWWDGTCGQSPNNILCDRLYYRACVTHFDTTWTYTEVFDTIIARGPVTIDDYLMVLDDAQFEGDISAINLPDSTTSRMIYWDVTTGRFTQGLAPAGISDHGALTGLADDDHTQYALLAGRPGNALRIDTIRDVGAGTTIVIDDNLKIEQNTDGWSKILFSDDVDVDFGTAIMANPFELHLASGDNIVFTTDGMWGNPSMTIGNDNSVLPGTNGSLGSLTSRWKLYSKHISDDDTDLKFDVPIGYDDTYLIIDKFNVVQKKVLDVNSILADSSLFYLNVDTITNKNNNPVRFTNKFYLPGIPLGSGGSLLKYNTSTAQVYYSADQYGFILLPQEGNKVFAGPAITGVTAVPSFRFLVRADLLKDTSLYTASTGIIKSNVNGIGVELPLFTSTDRGMTPSSGGGSTNFLRADGTWQAPPGDGLWSANHITDVGYFTDTTYKIGIGKTKPTERLDVNGNIVLSGNLLLYGTGQIKRRVGIVDYGIYWGTPSLLSHFIGNSSGKNTATGVHNLGFGDSTLMSLTTGYNNTAIGRNSLKSNTTGLNNVAIGHEALIYNISGDYNVAIGIDALRYGTNVNHNTAIGSDALFRSNATGNTAVGSGALQANTTGTFNTAMGNGAMYSHVSGFYNVGIGNWALASSLTSTRIVALGYSAAYLFASGEDGVFIGHKAGENQLRGNGAIIIGSNVLSKDTTANNQLNIGNTIHGIMTAGSKDITIEGDVNLPDLDSLVKSHVVYYDSITGKLTYGKAGTGGGISELNDLSDVDLTLPDAGDILRFDDVSMLWKNVPLPASSGDNLGNHIATQYLDMGLNDLLNVDTAVFTQINVDGYAYIDAVVTGRLDFFTTSNITMTNNNDLTINTGTGALKISSLPITTGEDTSIVIVGHQLKKQVSTYLESLPASAVEWTDTNTVNAIGIATFDDLRDSSAAIRADMGSVGKRIYSKVSDDNDWSGDAILLPYDQAVETADINAGDVVYINSSGRLELTDADALATMNAIGIALETVTTGSGTMKILLKGTYRCTACWTITSLTTGGPLFASTTTGDIQVTAPTAVSDVTQILGLCLDAANEILYFDIDRTIITATSP